jgi:hypothetical protein
MHEIYAHTVFEPSTKKHIPFFSCFVKKEAPFMASMIRLCPEVCFVSQHIFIQQSIAEDLLRIQSFCRWCNMMYDVMLCGMMLWYDAIW